MSTRPPQAMLSVCCQTILRWPVTPTRSAEMCGGGAVPEVFSGSQPVTPPRFATDHWLVSGRVSWCALQENPQSWPLTKFRSANQSQCCVCPPRIQALTKTKVSRKGTDGYSSFKPFPASQHSVEGLALDGLRGQVPVRRSTNS